MPYLKIQTNCVLENEQGIELSAKASRVVAEQLGKPERYVMVAIDDRKTMLFAGTSSPLVYMELKSIGLPDDKTTMLSAALCQLVNTELGVNPDRIYIEFANAERHMWGWDRKTF